MSTRREFLYRLGTGAVGLMGLTIMPGCETISVDSKISGELASFITPADHPTWYWQSGKGGMKSEDAPEIPREEWSLAIHDRGDEKLGDIEFDALQRRESNGEAITYIKTMRCVFGTQVGALSDSRISTGIFKGIPLHRVLEPYEFPATRKLRTFGQDGFKSNLSYDRVADRDVDSLPVILAYELNGQPISAVRGGPVRLIIPEMWGYKNMKWLAKIQATDKVREDLDDTEGKEFFGKYEREKFGSNKSIDDPAEMALNSAVTKPAAVRQEVEGPDITIAGVSFAGGTAIESVEISLDERPFEPVDLLDREKARQTIDQEFTDAFDAAEHPGDHWPPANVWAVWSAIFEGLSPGKHSVTVRATDTDGQTQPASSSDELKIASRKRIPFTVV